MTNHGRAEAYHPRYFVHEAFPEISGNLEGARIQAGPVSFVPNFRKTKNEQLEAGLPSATISWRTNGARLNLHTDGAAWLNTVAEMDRVIPSDRTQNTNGVYDVLQAAFRDGDAHKILAAYRQYCARFGDAASVHPSRVIAHVSQDLEQRQVLKKDASRLAKKLVFAGRGLEAAENVGKRTGEDVNVATNVFSSTQVYNFKNAVGRKYFKPSLKALQRLEVAWRAKEALSQLTPVRAEDLPEDQRRLCSHSDVPAGQATVRGSYNNALVLESSGRQYVVPVAEIIGMHVFANLPAPILQDNATVTFEKMKWKQSIAKETHSMPVKWNRARPAPGLAP